MPRPRAKSRRPTAAPVPADPALLELELGGWAGERVARGGRRDALLGKVEALRLSLDGRSIEARVRGNRPLPYHVNVAADSPQPSATCTCSRQSAGPCRHAVAAVEALRFPQPPARLQPPGARSAPGRRRVGSGRIIQPAAAAPGFVLIGGAERSLTRDERIAVVREAEILARRQRARRGRARVRPLVRDGGPPSFEVEPRQGGAERVTLRGLAAQGASCTCGAFLADELQTCAHVERVRAWLPRHRKEVELDGRRVSVWCQARPWLERVPDALREIRVDPPAEGLAAGLERWFEREGWLRPAPPQRGRVAWALRAIAAARRHARAAGLAWDLDPAVPELLREEVAAEALARQRAGAGERVWNEVGSRLRLTLHDYQREGARFLTATGRAFLADDMGLGKTVQAVVAALALRRAAGAARALVVCPASLKHQWSAEIRKICSEDAVVVEGPPVRRRSDYRAWREGFLIINYELLLRDLDEIRATAFDLVVLDEAQRIKNWSTQTARAVKRLASPHAFILTGTPLENRLVELHSLVEFLHPRALGPRWRLFPFHSVTESHGRVIAYEGLDVLRRRLGGFFLRRERKTVMDQLPPRTDNTFWTGMTAMQRRPYRKHAAVAASLLARREPLGSADIRALFRALTGMRILCNAWGQYAWDEIEPALGSGLDPRMLHSPKLEEFTRVLEDLIEQSEEKIVVFSQWERMLRLAWLLAQGALERRDLRADVFHGGLASRARGEMLDAFRSDPEFRVLFSTDAGGQGLNLQHASIVVHLEVPWNPAVLEQRVGRVHRIGQRRSVQVLHFVTRGAIEERVLRVVQDKRALFDGLLVDEADEVVLDAPARAGFLDRIRQLLDGAKK